MVKKIKDNKPMRKRKFRKPRSRWMDEWCSGDIIRWRLLTGGWWIGTKKVEEDLKGVLGPIYVVESDMTMMIIIYYWHASLV